MVLNPSVGLKILFTMAKFSRTYSFDWLYTCCILAEKICSDELIIKSILSLNVLDFINHISNHLHLKSSHPYIGEACGLFSPLAMSAMYVDSRTTCHHWKLVGAGGLQVGGHCLK